MMGRFKPIGSALDRSLGMLKSSKAPTRYNFPHSPHAPLSNAVAPIRRYVGSSTTESAHGPNSRKSNLRASISPSRTLPYNNTSARFMSSSSSSSSLVTSKIQNLVDNNKVRFETKCRAAEMRRQWID